MREISLAQIKRDLPPALSQQLWNVSVFNMCRDDHFPDEASCLRFAQGFGLIPDKHSEVMHCKGKVCRFEKDCARKVGYYFRCYNKKPHSKKICLAKISPLRNTCFEGSQLRLHDIFKLVLCFVSNFAVAVVIEQMGLSEKTVIDWFEFCRQVCKVIIANEFLEKIGEGMTVEVEYRRRYFRKVNMEPMPLDDKFLLFWHHIKLVYPGPGKVGLTFPLSEDDNCTEISEDHVEVLNDLGGDSYMEPPSKKKITPTSPAELNMLHPADIS